MSVTAPPGRCTVAETRLALAAPAPAGGFTSGYVRARGLRLHVRAHLPATVSGPALVGVHGLAVSHRYLMPTGYALTRRPALTGCPVYLPDLPGFGLSRRPGKVLRAEEHADVLADWLASMPGAVLFANSYGC